MGHGDSAVLAEGEGSRIGGEEAGTAEVTRAGGVVETLKDGGGGEAC